MVLRRSTLAAKTGKLNKAKETTRKLAQNGLQRDETP